MKLLVGLDAIIDDTQSMPYPASNWCIDDFAVLVCPVILVPDINQLKMPYGSVFQAVQISERRPLVVSARRRKFHRFDPTSVGYEWHVHDPTFWAFNGRSFMVRHE